MKKYNTQAELYIRIVELFDEYMIKTGIKPSMLDPKIHILSTRQYYHIKRIANGMESFHLSDKKMKALSKLLQFEVKTEIIYCLETA